jgi:two-component system catabolic regulation response regulator CreB
MTRILLVEDEDAIAESLEYALRRDGFEVTHAPTVQQACAALPGADLMVLDLMLPDGSGFDLLQQARQDARRIPVIILSSRDEEADRVAGLEGGADDYVIKPFSPREVVARIRAVLRRLRPVPSPYAGPPISTPTPVPAPVAAPAAPQPAAYSAAAGLVLDQQTRRTSYNGAAVDLTRTEFDLLSVLSSAPDRVFSRQQLIDRIFGEGYAVTDRTIDAHVKALRKKLSAAGADPDLIQTERGVGYRLRQAP